MLLKIYLLGQFKILADQRTIALPSRPAQSLLAYLVLNAGLTFRREKLASLLWPESSETNARSYLRQALWRIRRILEDVGLDWKVYLQVSDIEIGFADQCECWVDARRLLDQVRMPTLEQMLEVAQLYRGELLPGFYEEWVLAERDRLQAAYHQKMNQLTEMLVEIGRWDEAMVWAEEWIRLGDAPEPAFRILMQAHAGLGDLGMVNATYQRCAASLHRELGLEPSLETLHLYEQIRNGEFKFRAPTPSAGIGGVEIPSFFRGGRIEVQKPVFVAREAELGQLNKHLELVSNGQGRVVFITGEAGSGKTVLVQEFTQRALEAKEELIVATGYCNAFTGIGDPYLPFREILGLLTGDVEDRWAAGAITDINAQRLLNTKPLAVQTLVESGPDLMDTFVPRTALQERINVGGRTQTSFLVSQSERADYKPLGLGVPSSVQSDLFEQYTRVLQAMARKFLLVMVVEDLQWADHGSISLLFHFGRRLVGSRILLVGTYRPVEVAIGRGVERHPLEAVVNELQRDFGDILLPLGQAEKRDFVEALLDSEPNRLGNNFRDMLYRQTHGHPLFTIELLRGLQERGDLIRDQENRWIEGPSLDWEKLPARVEAVIAERVNRLTQALHAALNVACVEGEYFTAEVVSGICSISKLEMLESLSGELDRKHQLVSAQNIIRTGSTLLSRYRFRHILFQKYLYGSLDEVERVHLHEQVGNALEGLYRGQEDSPEFAAIVVPLALHFQKAWVDDKAVYYLQKAGERAIQMSAFHEAIAHLSNAQALLKSLPDTPERLKQELAIQVSLGIAGKFDYQDNKREKALTRARELCQQMDKKVELVRVLGELSIFPYVRAEYKPAYELAVETLKAAQQTGDALLEMLGHWHVGFVLFGRGKFEESHSHLKKVISSYDPVEHHSAFVSLRGSDAGVSAMAYEVCNLWCLGYPDQAIRMSQEALDLAHSQNHLFTLADVLCMGGCLFNKLRRDLQLLEANSEELRRLAVNKGFYSYSITGMCFLGEVKLLQGSLQEGISQIREALEIRERLKPKWNITGFSSALAQGQAMSGQPAEGLATLDRVFSLVDESDERFFEAELYRLYGEFQLKDGYASAAEASLRKAIEVAHCQHARSFELRAATDLANLMLKQERRAEAHSLLHGIYSWFTEGFDTPDLLAAKALLDELT